LRGGEPDSASGVGRNRRAKPKKHRSPIERRVPAALGKGDVIRSVPRTHSITSPREKPPFTASSGKAGRASRDPLVAGTGTTPSRVNTLAACTSAGGRTARNPARTSQSPAPAERASPSNRRPCRSHRPGRRSPSSRRPSPPMRALNVECIWSGRPFRHYGALERLKNPMCRWCDVSRSRTFPVFAARSRSNGARALLERAISPRQSRPGAWRNW